MPDHTIDILILTDVDPNELTGLINQPGLLGTWTENQTIHVYWDPDHWSPQAQELTTYPNKVIFMACEPLVVLLVGAVII